jgi:hypothetical protein
MQFSLPTKSKLAFVLRRQTAGKKCPRPGPAPDIRPAKSREAKMSSFEI